MEGYGLDTYAETLLEGCIEELTPLFDELGEMITSVHFQAPSSLDIPISTLILSVDGIDHEFELSVDSESLPETVHDEDEVLPGICEIIGLDPTDDEYEGPGWGDIHVLPHCLFIHEILLAGSALLEELEDNGFELADGCAVSFGNDEARWDDLKEFEGNISSEMAQFETREQRDSLAELLYDQDEKQRWLLNL